MNIIKFKHRDFTKQKEHLTHDNALENELRINNFSIVNPNRTHMNYNLHDTDIDTAYNDLLKQSNVRNKDTVTFCCCALTLPLDYEGAPDVFFQEAYNVLKKIPETKHCIYAYVHYDEGRPHLQYGFMPLEEKEIIVKKREKVFDEKKQKKVSRNVEYKYKYNLNARKLIDKEFLDNFHYVVQEKMNERGIKATILTDERIEFNRLKKEKFEETQTKIKNDPENKSKYLDEYYNFWQENNPKDYDRHFKSKPKSHRIVVFEEQLKRYEEEQKKQIEEKTINNIEAYEEEAKEIIKLEENRINNNTDNVIKKLEQEAQLRIQAKEEIIKNHYQEKNEQFEEFLKNKDRFLNKKKKALQKATAEEYNEIVEQLNTVFEVYTHQNNVYNDLINKHNDLVDKYNDQEEIHKKDIEIVKDFYNNEISKLQKVINDLKHYIDQIFEKLKKIDIFKPFEMLSQEEQLKALDEQIDRVGRVYNSIKPKQTEKTRNYNIDSIDKMR